MSRTKDPRQLSLDFTEQLSFNFRFEQRCEELIGTIKDEDTEELVRSDLFKESGGKIVLLDSIRRNEDVEELKLEELKLAANAKH